MAKPRIKKEDVHQFAGAIMNAAQGGKKTQILTPKPRAMLADVAAGKVPAPKIVNTKLPDSVRSGKTEITIDPKITAGVMGKKAAQRELLRDMTRDSMKWHTATSVPERARLFAANNERRKLLGLTYDHHTGRTLDTAGNSLSEPVRLAFPQHPDDYELRTKNMPFALPQPTGMQTAKTVEVPKTDLENAWEALEQARRDRANGILGGQDTAGMSDRIAALAGQVAMLENDNTFKRYGVDQAGKIAEAVQKIYGKSYVGIYDYKNVSVDEQRKADAAVARAKELIAQNTPPTDAEKAEAKALYDVITSGPAYTASGPADSATVNALRSKFSRFAAAYYGAANGMTMGGLEALGKWDREQRPELAERPDYVKSAQESQPVVFGVGEVGGNLYTNMLLYGSLGRTIEGARAFQGIKNPVIRSVAANQASDLVISAPLTAASSAMQGKDRKDIAKDVAIDQGLGLLGNIGAAGLEAFGRARAAKNMPKPYGMNALHGERTEMPTPLGMEVMRKGQEPRLPVDAQTGFARDFANYQRQIDGVFTGKLNAKDQIHIGKTPDILVQFGANPLDLTMTQSTARKIAYPEGYFGGRHNLGVSALKQLPEQIRDPLAILKSNTQKDSLVILTAWNDTHGDPVIVPIHLNKKGEMKIENQIASSYGKPRFDPLLGINNSNVLYTKSNESINQLLAGGLQLPTSRSDDPLVAYSVAHSAKKINPITPKNTEPNLNILQSDLAVNFLNGGNITPKQLEQMLSDPATLEQLEEAGINVSDFRDIAQMPIPHAIKPDGNDFATPKPYGSEALKTIAPDSSVGAATSGFDPYSQMQNAFGTIEPGEAPHGREVDVPKSTDGSDRVSLYARTLMEAPATPDGMISDYEKQVANGLFSHDVRKDKVSIERAVKTITDKGYGGAMAQWEDVIQGRRAAEKDDIVLAQMLYTEASKVGDTQTAMKLAAEIAAEGTRGGQNVQAMRLLKKLTPEGRLYYCQRSVNNLTQELQKKYGEKAAKLQINEQLAKNLLDAKSGREMDKAQKALLADIANQMPTTWWDKWDAWRYTAMLANPRTHIRNIAGNLLFGNRLLSPRAMKNKVGAVLETATDKASRMLGGDGIERTKSLLTRRADREFAKQDFKEMASVLQGDGKYNTADSIKSLKTNVFSGGVLEKIGIGKANLANVLNTASNLNSNALEAEDVFALRGTYVDSLAQYMKANRLSAKDMTGDVLDRARVYAVKEAQKATFRDASTIATGLNRFANGGGKLRKVAIEGLVPFKKTPANIVTRGVEYSPYGVLNGVKQMVIDVRRGTKTASQAIDTLSAGLTGTGITALGMYLASQGLITGAGDENGKKQSFDEMGGTQSYALDLSAFGVDKTYTIDWTAPASLPLFVGVELWNTMHAGDNDATLKYAVDALCNITEPIFNLTMMDGLNRAIRSATFDDGTPISSALASAVTDYFTQGVPTVLGQINRSFFDDTRRSTYIEHGSPLPKALDRALQQQMAKIPGLSQKLNPYTDVFGREQKNGNWFENFFSPGYMSDKKAGEAEKAISALYEATGDATVLPSKPAKYYTINNEKKWLTADQYLRLSNIKGRESLKYLETLVSSVAYQDMGEQERASAVKDIYQYAAEIAANKTYGKALEGTVQTVAESGIEPGLFYGYKEMEDTLHESMETYEARDIVFHAIQSDTSLSEYQRNLLYDTLLIKGTSDEQYEKYVEVSGTVTKEEYVDAMLQAQTIKGINEEVEDGRATLMATEFSKYLDAMGYDKKKRAALQNTFKFFNMFPAEPENYTYDMLLENGGKKEKQYVSELEKAGITAPQYLEIKKAASAAEYEKGKSGAKLAAVSAIVWKHVDNYDEYAAVMHMLGYKNINGAKTGRKSSKPASVAGLRRKYLGY
ncbi:MuF-C-terminal domain-containing protein [Intestinibacillus massiliensis]